MATLPQVLAELASVVEEPKYRFINAAAGIVNTAATLFFSADNLVNGGGSIKAEVETQRLPLRPVEVPVIDLAQWMLDTFQHDDFILVKMDIEGAEFDLVPRLIQTGAIRLIDDFKLEWHDRFKSEWVAKRWQITKELAELGIKTDGAWI